MDPVMYDLHRYEGEQDRRTGEQEWIAAGGKERLNCDVCRLFHWVWIRDPEASGTCSGCLRRAFIKEVNKRFKA